MSKDLEKSFDGMLNCEGIEYRGEWLRFKSPPTVRARVVSRDGLVTVKAAVKGEVALSCARCQGEAEFSFSHKFEEDITGAASGILDLTELIEGEIVAQIPIRVLCDEGCKGLCQFCGKDLNLGGCDCEPRPWRKIDIEF